MRCLPMQLQHGPAVQHRRLRANSSSRAAAHSVRPLCPFHASRSTFKPLLQQSQQQRLAGVPAAVSPCCSSSSRLPASTNSSSRQQFRSSTIPTQAARGDSSADAGEPFNPMKAIKADLGMQSNQLDADIRERVERAIAGLGYRVTVGDVAARAGVKLSEADRALKALAFDSLGNIEVSQQGEVVYAFDRDFVSKIRNKSWSQRLRPLFKKVVNVGNYLARVAFGTALVVSALVVWLAVIAITSSRDDNRRDSGGFGGRGYVWFDPTDIILIWDPYYSRHTRERVEKGGGMTFVEAVFSFVFGDGDPNLNYEERRWRALGSHIQRLGGVVSAEEMAPFLDPPPLGRRIARGSEKYEDESFVLPALIRFNGEPFVDDEGRLLYKFPDLQVVAGEGPSLRLTATEAKVPLEKEWAFSEASPGQQAGALLLGVVNVVGVITLSTLLADPISKLALYRQGLGFVLGLLPYLQTYAAAFFGIPLIRLLLDGRRNAQIDQRNDARLQAVTLLQSGDPDLAAKSASARKLGNTRVIGRQDIIYTTEKGTDEQVNAQEAEEFDRRLGRDRRQLPSRGQNRIDDVFDRRDARVRQQQRQAEEINVDWGSRGDSSSRREQRQRSSRRDDDWDRLDRW